MTKRYYDAWMEEKGFRHVDFPKEKSFFRRYYIDESPVGKNHLVAFKWFDQAGPVVPERIEGYISYEIVDDLIRPHFDDSSGFPTNSYPFMRKSANDPRHKWKHYKKEEEILPALKVLDEHFEDFINPFFDEFGQLEKVYSFLEYFAKMKFKNQMSRTVWSLYTPLYRMILKAWFKIPDFEEYCSELRVVVREEKEEPRPRFPGMSFPDGFDALVNDCQKIWMESTNAGKVEFIQAPHHVTSEERANPGPVSKFAFAEMLINEEHHWLAKQGIPLPEKKVLALEKLRKAI